MEYSKSLSRISKILLPQADGVFKIFELYNPTRQWWVITSQLILSNGTRVHGTASGKSRINCFHRACIEAGETEIASRLNLNSRTGLAGGFISSAALIRARNELLERDAFLHHYRNREPMKKVVHQFELAGAEIYEMNCADSTVRTYMALSVDRSGCLKFGLGASSNSKIALTRAVEELRVVELDHLLRPDNCSQVYRAEKPPKNLADFHHSQSRDPRNKLIFDEITKCTKDFRSRTKSIEFTVKKYSSSLRFIKYIHLTSSSLELLRFGEPEPFTSASPPIYHPLW